MPGGLHARSGCYNREDDASDAQPMLSLMAPCHNEQEVLPLFVERVCCLLKELDADYRIEVLLIDDGSTDATWTLICNAVNSDPRFRGIKLSRNFGQQAALSCGYEFAAGDAVVSLDADLQDPPEVIPEMVARWRDGADVVFTVRASRTGETWAKLLTARLFYRLSSRLCGNAIRAESGDFRLLSRRSLDAFLSLREQHRYVRGMVQWLGFRTAEVAFDRPDRAAGRTKYSYWALAALAVEAFVTSGRSFLGLAGRLTAVISGLCLLGWMGLLIAWGLGFPVEGVVGGAVGLLVVLGTASVLFQVVAAEYLGRIFEQVRQRPVYLVEEICVQQPTPPQNLTSPQRQNGETLAGAAAR
jgi:glycosyltransferase involved in cell wall biosynthesis